jgi:hypothetical protein
MVESTIGDNRAGIDGGGLYNAGLAFLTDNTLADNTAERNGGGILNTGGLGIRNTMLRGNRALGERGGGIESFGGTQSSSAIVMLNSTLLNNSASVLGGGLSSNSDTRLINVTISNNAAGQTGGGINVESSGLITATNVTISQNNVISATGTGAGIRSGGLTLLDNSIVAQNATNGTGAACTGGMGNLTSRGHNLTDDESCAFNEPTDLAADDARLAELGDNGGATPTHALLAGSPAIDSGSPATCPAIDQRGFVRPTDGDEDGSAVCDIGAYEAAARSLPSVVIDDEGGSAQVPDSDLEIGFPDGAVNVSLTINYTELITATYPLTDEVYWLRGFVLQGFNETLQTITTLSQPINITLDYAAVEQPAVFSANELAIVLWDSEQGQWVPVQPSAACATCSVRIDTEAQQVTIVTDHLGEFALLHPQQIATDPTDPTDPEPLSVYLPLVQRS